MYKTVVRLRPDRPNLPLRTLWIGRATAGLVLIEGMREEVRRLDLVVRYPDGDVHSFSSTDPSGEGIWIEAYAVGAVRSGTYQLYATVGDRTVFMGEGDLCVLETLAGDLPPPSPVSSPRGIYVPVEGAVDSHGRALYAVLKVTAEPGTGLRVAEISEDLYIFSGGVYEKVQ